jgi:hypothetical protein
MVGRGDKREVSRRLDFQIELTFSIAPYLELREQFHFSFTDNQTLKMKKLIVCSKVVSNLLNWTQGIAAKTNFV